MPRVTRSALSSPARASPRESTKASSTSSKSSPAPKTRQGSKAAEPEPQTSVEENEEKVTRRQAKDKGTGDAGTRRRSGHRSSETAEEADVKTKGKGAKTGTPKQQKDDSKEEEASPRGRSLRQGGKRQQKEEEQEEEVEKEETPTSRGKTRGRGAKQTKKEEEEEKDVEMPSSSRRKRGKQQMEEEEDKGAEEVKAGTPTSRGRGRKSAGKETEEEQQEIPVKDVQETPTRRGRGKLQVKSQDKITTPSPPSSRGRSLKEKQEETEAMEVEEVKGKEETTTRRRGRKPEVSASEPKSPEVTMSPRGRRRQPAKEVADVSSGRRGRSAKKEESEKKDLSAKSGEDLEAPALKDETAVTEVKPQSADPPSIEQEAPSIHLENVTETPAKKEGDSEMPKIEAEQPMSIDEEAAAAKEKNVDAEKQKQLGVNLDKAQNKLVFQGSAAEGDSAVGKSEGAPSDKQKDIVDDAANGIPVEKSLSSQDQNRKRKLDQQVVDSESLSSKRTKINGDETIADKAEMAGDVKSNKSSDTSQTKSKSDVSIKDDTMEDTLKDYVVVSNSDIPPPDSKEVVEAAPKLTTKTTAADATATDTGKSASSSDQVTSSQVTSDQKMDSSSDTMQSSKVSDTSSQTAGQGKVPESTSEPMEVDDADSAAVTASSDGKQQDAVLTTNNLQSAKQNPSDSNTHSVFPTAGTSHDIFHRTFLPNPSVPLNSTDVSHRFSIVTYNILADCNMRKPCYNYDYTEPEYLEQEYRHKLLMEELRYLDSDIVCLQEVNPDYFKNMLEPAMNSMGYQGGMMRRTIEEFNEGEATFFKINRFSLIDSEGVSLTELANKELEEAGLSDEVKQAAQKYLKKADVAYISQLKCNFTHNTVTIGNVHIVWDDHKHPDIQCIQIACAIKEVVNRAGSNEASHVICGDFNSNSSSPGYQLACDGYLSDSSLSTLQALENLEVSEGSKSLVNHVWRAFQHTSSTLRSAYSTVQKHEPALTTFTRFYHDAVDYVFHNSSSLETLGVLETVNAEVIDATGGLPSKSFPSDHVSLKAELSFKN